MSRIDDELEQARNKVATRIVLSSERPMGRLSSLGGNWLYRGEYRSVEDDLRVIQSLGAQDVARLISRDVRETDLLSRTDRGQLSVVLLDADLENSIGVIDRLMARLDHYQFPKPLTFEVGAACCPTHGADAATLRRAAESRPIRGRGDRSNAQ